MSEFRGFALVDEYAPLIFINGADFTSAQMFTLIHELVHIWIGEGGVSNFEVMQPLPIEIERYCNAVAAEVLVPRAELTKYWPLVRGVANPFADRTSVQSQHDRGRAARTRSRSHHP